ncbi:MAG: Non-ribosomal peptide synthetase [Proteobacteria bacterium]|nr:Non-ribosomal peptide synthetase [Pseudomonadota bacterium]
MQAWLKMSVDTRRFPPNLTIPYRYLVPIRGNPQRASLFLVHSVAGELTWLQLLAQKLSPELALYGFAAPGLNADAPFFFRLENMAAAYLHELRQAQPEGPYRLGGYSLGGVIAFEMAQQLQREGELVDLLIMIDAFAPQPERTADIASWSRNGLLMQVVANQLALQWQAETLLPADALGKLPFSEHSAFAARHLLAHSQTPHAFRPLQSYLRRCQTMMRVHTQLLADYQAQALPQPVQTLLYRNTRGLIARQSALQLPQLPETQRDPPHDWAPLLGQAPVTVDVDEEHFMFGREPVMAVIAQSLNEYLGARALP